uniref:Vitellogenin n=1 Tax=Acrobeloides nanus TaxID=290746 RepID=A0A914DZH7_9BILA
FEETTSEIRLKITNHSTFAEIFVQASNGDCSHQLLTSLKARILVATSQIYRQPKESLQKQISYNNIEELWNSTLEKLS